MSVRVVSSASEYTRFGIGSLDFADERFMVHVAEVSRIDDEILGELRLLDPRFSSQ